MGMVFKRKTLIFLFIIIGIVITIGIYMSKAFIGSRPFSNLSVNDISDATVEVNPPFVKYSLNDTEIQELVMKLKNIVIYNQDNSYTQYDGAAIIYNLIWAINN